MENDTHGDLLAHNFVPLRRETPDQVSRRVAEAFCSAYQRERNAIAKVLDVETERVDAMVCIDGSPVALEFVRYLEHDEFYQDELADSTIREMISIALTEQGFPPLQVRIGWGVEARRKRQPGESSTRVRIPRGKERDGFLANLIALTRYVLARNHFLGRRISFRDNSEALNKKAPPGYAFVDAARYADVANCCEYLELQLWNHDSRPNIRTSFDARNTGMPETHLRTVINDKLARLDYYRQGVGNKPLWLIVYSDTYPPSARLHPGLRDEVLLIMGEAATSREKRFDKVWWLAALEQDKRDK